MLAAKKRLRVAARGSGPGAKRRRPCPPLRAAATGRRRDEERPEPSTPPPAGRTRNWTRCSAPQLPRRSRSCPLMRLRQHRHGCLRQHRPVLGAVGRPDLVEPLTGSAGDVAAGRAGAPDMSAGFLAGTDGDWSPAIVQHCRRGLPVGLKAGRGQGRRGQGRGRPALGWSRAWGRRGRCFGRPLSVEAVGLSHPGIGQTSSRTSDLRPL